MDLNLPDCQLKFSGEGDKISVWDPIRSKYVAFTPEENVRQHFVHYLIESLGYPATHLANEVPLNLNGLSKRCDTVAYDRQLNARVIVEYKAPSVPIISSTFAQIARYNLVLKVDYLIVSNGLKHYCVRMDYGKHSYTFLKEIPSYIDINSGI